MQYFCRPWQAADGQKTRLGSVNPAQISHRHLDSRYFVAKMNGAEGVVAKKSISGLNRIRAF